MARGDGSPDDYVFQVHDKTRQYVQELLRENERLREITAALEDKVASIETESLRFNERYAEIEKQNNDLANLYVASYRLHSTLDRQEVISVIEEIIINLIGSEELAILERNPDSAWSVVGAVGMEPERLGQIVAGIEADRGVIGKAVAGVERFVVSGENRDDLAAPEVGLTACVPLVLDGEVTGVIAIFGLLVQKPGVEPIDLQLFDLLASHAATALYASRESAESKVSAGV
ncbi:MAG: GAF domain-containing protein [Myxococcales bacterium]|nr:GAF domain-containing protein [Myxococcales bacterium]